MDETVLGALLVILGAGLGYASARYESWLERRRSKTTLATGMLSELRWLDGLLRQIVQHGPASYYDPLEHPMIEATLPHLALFDAATAERLSHFHGLLRDTRAGMNRYRDAPSAVAGRKEEYSHFIKAKAYFAASAIPSLRDALVSEGGQLPPPITEKPIEGPDLPPLPPRPFDSFDPDSQ